MGKRIGNLGLVNYIDHPTEKGFRVFNFNTLVEADLFEKMLTEKKIWFERDVEEHENEALYLFGIKDKDFGRAQNCNFMVSAKTRKPVIPFAFLRYALVIFFFAILALAITGYIKSQ